MPSCHMEHSKWSKGIGEWLGILSAIFLNNCVWKHLAQNCPNVPESSKQIIRKSVRGKYRLSTGAKSNAPWTFCWSSECQLESLKIFSPTGELVNACSKSESLRA